MRLPLTYRLCSVLFVLGANSQPTDAENTTVMPLAPMRQDDSCQIANETPMRRICLGKVTRDLSDKYKDQTTVLGTRYGIWYEKFNSSRLLVAFHESKLLKCMTLEYKMDSRIRCNASSYTFYFYTSQVDCLPLKQKYVSDLVNECLLQMGNDILSSRRILQAAAPYSTVGMLRSDSRQVKLYAVRVMLAHVVVFVVARLLQMT